MERRLAAILAADVAGYTALMGADEAGTLQRFTGLRRDYLEPLIGEHKGRIVKLMGDGLLVEFASVVDAVVCALAMYGRANHLDRTGRLVRSGSFSDESGWSSEGLELGVERASKPKKQTSPV